MSIICPKCKTANPDNAASCTLCEHSFDDDPISDLAEAARRASNSKAPPPPEPQGAILRRMSLCPKCKKFFQIELEGDERFAGGLVTQCDHCGYSAKVRVFERAFEKHEHGLEQAAAEQERSEAKRKRDEKAREARERRARAEWNTKAQNAEAERRARDTHRQEYVSLVRRVYEARLSKLDSGTAFCFLSGIAAIACWIAGVYMFTIEAASSESLLEAIATGMGIYFIGKGFLCMAMACIIGPLNFRIGHDHELRRMRVLENEYGFSGTDPPVVESLLEPEHESHDSTTGCVQDEP